MARIASLFLCLWVSAALQAQTALVLKNGFIEANKNRATMDINMMVDRVLKRPHGISKGGDDGDIHMAGRSSDIGLPLVAELMNAGASDEAGVRSDVERAGGGHSVAISGAWRIWFEHPGGDQIQGEHVPPPANTNPSHVFEIHPITKFGGDDAAQSVRPICKYTPYDATTAFSHYENLITTIDSNDTATTISSSKIGYNYAEFLIELSAAPTPSDDGGFLVLATVMRDPDEPVVSDQRRMVFLPNTPAAAVAAGSSAGTLLHVLGIPRVNLERISTLTAQQPGETITTALPYEMIIVGVYPESGDACDAQT